MWIYYDITIHHIIPQCESKKTDSLIIVDKFHDLITGITVTCVLHTIGCNDEQRMLRHVFLTGILVDVPDMMDSSADCVQKRRAATDRILLIRHRRNIFHIHTVMFLPLFSSHKSVYGQGQIPEGNCQLPDQNYAADQTAKDKVECDNTYCPGNVKPYRD